VCIFLLTGSDQLRAQTLTLENEHLYIEFQESLPAVDHYVLKSNNQVIYGDIGHYGDIGQYHARIYYEGRQHTIYPAVANITKEGDRVCYHLKSELNLQQVVTFDLCYILSGNSVELTFGNVQEIPNYKLVVVRSPHLLTVRADQGGAKLVFPWAEGRLIDVATTTSGSYSDIDTNGWLHAMTLGMLYHQGALAICSYDNLDMILEESVFDDPDNGRLGVIATHFYYRLPPGNYELASFVDIFDEFTTSLSARLTFLTDYDQDGDIDWIDGAKFLRDQVQAVPEPRYVSSWITKLVGSRISNITQHLETIEKLYHLTDHNKIYIYLLEYGPITNKIFGYEGDIDPQWASLDELKYVFETAEKSFNTFLGFHDNYIDYYPNTPDYDPALRIVYHDGTFYPGFPLPGYPEAYAADPYEYAMQIGLERVRRTLSLYPIKESHHIDAFTFVPPRDFSLETPSNREKNRRGVKLIIDEFNKYGVNVTGEGLTGFFVGPGIGWFLRTPRIVEDDLPWSGTEVIPLLEFIYHGKTLYGLQDVGEYDGWRPPEQVDIYAFLEPLLLGASSGAHITWIAPDDLEIDKFYLIDLPWMALNQRFMEDYIVDGSYRKITYDDDTFVEIDYESKTYTVQVDGRVIGRNYTTFFPKNENTFLIFSREAKTISESLPDEWAQDMILLKLTENGINKSVPFQVTDGRITFQAEANTPYKLMKLNPLNDTTEFVKQQYRDFLNREAEPGGLQYWVGVIDSGAMTRAQVIESFFWSEEFGATIAPVVRLYFAYFLRIPDYEGLMYWINVYKSGWSLEAISDSFAGSEEFQQTYGALSNEAFVNLVYQNILGRAPDPGGYAFWVGELNSGRRTRGQVMIGFSESPEYKGLTGHEVYVTMMYIGMLRRAPEEEGFNFWVNYLDSGNSGLALIDGFLYSQEYADRFQ